MPKNKGVIVAIHGVGAPAPGSILIDLTKVKDGFYERTDFVSEGTSFAAQISDDEARPDLLEANWSDIKRPPRSIMGVAEWILSLSFALSRANLPWTGKRLFTGWLHILWFEVVLLWVLFPVLLGLMHANLSGYRLFIGDSAVIAMAALTVRLTWKMTIPARVGGIITLVGLVALAGILACSPGKRDFINPRAVQAYGLAQLSTVVLIALTGIEVSMRALFGNITLAGALARLAFAYLPLAMLSALGSSLWAITLNIIVWLGDCKELSPQWKSMFLLNVGYDLKLVEWAMAEVTAALALYVLAAAVIYFVSRRGSVAHAAIYGALALTPLLLPFPGALFIATSPLFDRVLQACAWPHLLTGYAGASFGKIFPSIASEDVLTIYTVSALRIVPWIGIAITPIAILLDVLADVVFYVTNPDLKVSSSEACNNRLKLILKYAQKEYAWIHVVGHSQGSVIALTVLSKVPPDAKLNPKSDLKLDVPFALTTMGCPLATLYERYLGWPISFPNQDWKNLFRTGDYIGGPVGQADVDQEIFARRIPEQPIVSRGHTDYWKDPRITERLQWPTPRPDPPKQSG